MRSTIGDTADTLLRDIRGLGLKANNCDLIYSVEIAIYDYVKHSNPDSNLFTLAEGFGSSMGGPARERVLAQTERDMDQLRELGVVARRAGNTSTTHQQYAHVGDSVRKDGVVVKVETVDEGAQSYYTSDGGCMGFYEVTMADVLLQSEVE